MLSAVAADRAAAAPPRPSAALTAGSTAGIGVLAGLAIWGEASRAGVPALLGLDLAPAAAGCALVPLLLRSRAVGIALALAVLAGATPAATPAATLGVLLVAQRRRLAVAVAVAAAGIAAHAVRGLWRPTPGLSFGWWLILVVVAHAALVGWGRLTQARSALIASLRERARRAEAEQGRRVAEARAAERARIAREMHDVLAHRLSLLATYAGALEYRPDAPPERLSRAAAVVRDSAHEALRDLRDVVALLRDEDGGTDAGRRPQPTLADLPRVVGESRQAGTPVELRDELPAGAVPPARIGRTAYRVVQEALTNARKHAAGRPVRVVLAGRPGAELTIDIGNPLPGGTGAGTAIPGSGTGLVGLTERVRLAGGCLDHGPQDGEFRLRARIPWPL